jgi:hypothetical protein
MTDTKQERISKLSSRFQKTEAVPEKKPKKRDRHSLYLDTTLVEEADRAYKEVNHQLYPAEISKSQFLEALLQYGLDHIEEVKQLIDIEEES